MDLKSSKSNLIRKHLVLIRKNVRAYITCDKIRTFMLARGGGPFYMHLKRHSKKFPQLHSSVMIATQAVGSITSRVLPDNNI